MNIVLWILQVLLALAFFAHGWMLLVPPVHLIEQMNATMPTSFRIFLGVAEVLAAIGLILPGVTRILPWLVTWAAGGLMFVMVSATIFHIARGEISGASQQPSSLRSSPLSRLCARRFYQSAREHLPDVDAAGSQPELATGLLINRE